MRPDFIGTSRANPRYRGLNKGDAYQQKTNPASPKPDPAWGWGAERPQQGIKKTGILGRDRLVVLARANPYVPASRLALRFGWLRTGMTVKKFLELADEAGDTRPLALTVLKKFLDMELICAVDGAPEAR